VNRGKPTLTPIDSDRVVLASCLAVLGFLAVLPFVAAYIVAALWKSRHEPG
jgi:hypothetical protein